MHPNPKPGPFHVVDVVESLSSQMFEPQLVTWWIWRRHTGLSANLCPKAAHR